MKTQKLRNIIKGYKTWKKENPDTCIEFCRNQKNMEDAIKYAALAIDARGKLHGHQWRIGRVLLEKFANLLLAQEHQIAAAKSFEELLQVIEVASPKGVSEVTCYDTATRIGAFMGIHPDKVYLHAGTRVGAEKLLGTKIKQRFIERSSLPEPFHNAALSNEEIEDILCIYEPRF